MWANYNNSVVTIYPDISTRSTYIIKPSGLCSRLSKPPIYSSPGGARNIHHGLRKVWGSIGCCVFHNLTYWT